MSDAEIKARLEAELRARMHIAPPVRDEDVPAVLAEAAATLALAAIVLAAVVKKDKT